MSFRKQRFDKEGKRTFMTYARCLLCNKGIIYGQLMALERYEGHREEGFGKELIDMYSFN